MHTLATIRRALFLKALLVSILHCINGSATAAPLVTIALKERAVVDHAIIHLGEIAEIQCTEAKKCTKLSRIDIKTAPSAGKSLVIRKAQIIPKLRTFGLSASDYLLTRSDSVQVVRRSVSVSPQTICQVVKAYIETHAPWGPDQLSIKNIRFKQPLRVPTGKLNLQVQAPKHTDWLGAIPFSVTVWVNNQLEKKITVPATVDVWSDVVLVSKPMGRGQPITDGSVKTVRMNLARAPSNALLSLEQALGKRMNRSVAANTVLRSDQIVIPPVIQRGDIVHVIAQSKALRITLKGIAKESGAVGERIRIQNMRSKKMIYALVLDGQTARVQY